jgi:hypothetical protein
MAQFKLTNLTKSLQNVPDNDPTRPRFSDVRPGCSVVLDDVYLEGLSGRAKADLNRVVTGSNPIFSYENVGEGLCLPEPPVEVVFATPKRVGRPRKVRDEPGNVPTKVPGVSDS